MSNPNVLVAAPFLGYDSEVWLWRQIVGFKRVQPSVLVWQSFNGYHRSLDKINIKVLDIDFNQAIGSKHKLKSRLFGVFNGNYCYPLKNELQGIDSYFNNNRPDVILCHFGYTALKMQYAAQKYKIPMVIHFHGRDLSVLLKSRWYRWSLKNMLAEVASVVVVGSHQYNLLKNEFSVPKVKLNLIPCGVPVDEFIPDENISNSKKGINFISVSRLSEEKGLEYLINAFAKIINKLPDAKLKIVGDGPLKDSLQDLVNKLKLNDSIEFCGTKKTDDVLLLLRQSDIFVQHSINSSNGSIEGFGVTISEAASVGLPVVATDCGGIKDQVIDGLTGFLVAQRNIESMADKMLILGKDYDLRKTMGAEGRKSMIECFDSKNQIYKLESVLLNSIS